MVQVQVQVRAQEVCWSSSHNSHCHFVHFPYNLALIVFQIFESKPCLDHNLMMSHSHPGILQVGRLRREIHLRFFHWFAEVAEY